MTALPQRAGHRRYRFAAVSGSVTYLFVFTVLASPWLRDATHGYPGGAPLTSQHDQRLVIWVFGWVARALTSTPGEMLNAPINVPAPAQLTGSEHFLSTALLVTPLWLLSGNATLATNLAVFLSFPVAAFAMQRLLLSMAVRAGAAWVGGLLFALGPLAVPASPQLVQYLPCWLPLTALAVRRTAQAPTLGRAFQLLLVLTGAAGMVAVSVLAGFSLPWFARAASEIDFARESANTMAGFTPLFTRVLRTELALHGVLATGGLLALSGAGPAAGVARAGLAIACLGLPFLAGPRPFGEPAPWAPFALLLASPLGFFRLWYRFAVLVGFGASLLAAAALDLAGRRRSTAVLIPAAAVAAVLLRGVHLPGAERVIIPAEDERIWPALRALPSGPLLVLPPTMDLVTQSMVAQPRHLKPLVLGYTGYPPPLRRWVDERVAALPDEDALDDLVTATGLRWVLLAPAGHRGFPPPGFHLTRAPGVERVLEQDGWVLLRITREPRSLWWRTSASQPPRPDSTVLGTPLRIAEPARHLGALAIVRVPPILQRGRPERLRLAVENAGDRPWPAAAGDGPGMRVMASWEPETSPGARIDAIVPLRRDVAPGERLEQWVPLVAPDAPGRWRLELRLVTESATLPAIRPAATWIEVGP